MKEYLPLGSIVKLKNGSRKVLIYGRAQVAKASGKQYDYLACPYPQGFLQSSMLLGFNHDQIEEVVFTGYADEEETAWVQRMNELMKMREDAAAKTQEAQKEETK